MYLLHLSSMHHSLRGLVLRPFHGHLVRIITVPLDLCVACTILSYLVCFILARRYTTSKKQIQFCSRRRMLLRSMRNKHHASCQAHTSVSSKLMLDVFLALVSAKYNMHYSANVPRRELTLFSRRLSHSTVVAIFSNSQYCRCQSSRGRFTFNPARGMRARLRRRAETKRHGNEIRNFTW